MLLHTFLRSFLVDVIRHSGRGIDAHQRPEIHHEVNIKIA